MISPTLNESLKTLALDLRKSYPRSPRETLADYILAARILDKCRAHLSGTAGEYTFGCGMDDFFFQFTGISPESFKEFVETGASDGAVAQWIKHNSKVKERIDIVKWNNQLRYTTIKEIPDDMQLYMEDYIEQYVPKHRPVYLVFDVFDLEECRL